MERGARNGNSGIACCQRLHLNLSIQCRLFLYMNMYVVISLIIIVLPGMQIYVDKFIVTVYHICVCVLSQRYLLLLASYISCRYCLGGLGTGSESGDCVSYSF